MTSEELEAMNALVSPLVRQGQSFEAIWATHAEELPVGVRCAYNYQEDGLLATADIELPRKVRMRKRRRKAGTDRERIDRSGRTYEDFQRLPLAERARVVQGDSVEGYEDNVICIMASFDRGHYQAKRLTCQNEEVDSCISLVRSPVSNKRRVTSQEGVLKLQASVN